MTKIKCDACGYNMLPLIMNTLNDDKYTYKLCQNCLLLFVAHALFPDMWKNLIKKFPDSFFLHDDFYDEDGTALQPVWKINYHIPPLMH